MTKPASVCRVQRLRVLMFVRARDGGAVNSDVWPADATAMA